MASRPRSSLAAASGLPTPGGGVSARRKSGLPSPGNSPTKGSKRPAENDDIAVRMSELQAAIRSKDPASYGVSGRRSALGASITNDEDEVEMLQPLTAQLPPEFASPRPVRRMPSSGSALRPTPQSSLRGLDQRPGGNDGTGTPTSTPGPGASFVRPGSSLSSSSYMSAHAANENRARSPLPADIPVTPAKRPSDSDRLAPTSSMLQRSSSNVSSTATYITARSSSEYGRESSRDAGLQEGALVKVAGMEGTLRYIGEVMGKPGTYAGVELSEAYSGQGKNNGTVQGHQYFSCKDKDGIFALLSKVEPLMPPPAPTNMDSPVSSRRTYSRPSSAMSPSSAAPTPRKPVPRASGSLVPPSTIARKAAKTSSDASQYASSQITAGSRASSYLNLTAKQLQERKDQTATSSTGSPASQRSPRKSAILGTSTSSNYATGGPTPKAIRTAGRPSGVPTTTRKSIGGTGTPGPAASIRRPGSSMRNHGGDVPSVPPLPTGIASTSSVAATPAKRYSGISRPTTPSGRPSSRLSNAGSVSRSVSRASSRASMLSGPSRIGHREGDDDAEETLRETEKPPSEELQVAKEALNKATREAEQAKLELLELTSDFKDEQKRRKALQLEVDELKRKAADSRLDQASAIDERQAEKELQSAELATLRQELASLRTQVKEANVSKQSMISELEQGHEILARVQEERDTSAKEAKSLAAQLDELQKAGRAMVDLYEEKFHNLEEDFMGTQEALQTREKQLREMQEELERHQALLAKREEASRDANNADALLAASLSGGRPPEAQESALAIENDDLRAELAHVKKRMASLEEQLYDAQVDFESQLEKEKSKRQESGETTEKLKHDVKEFKEKADKIKAEKESSDQRAQELENALKESQRTLEKERVELEGLRNEQAQSSSSNRNDELAHLRSALTVAQHENKDKEKEIRKLKSDLESLQEELKLMEEIREDVKADGPVDEHDTARLLAQLQDKDERIVRLQSELAQAGSRGLPKISTQPTDTDTVSTPVQASFNTLLSPHDHPSSPKESPSSSTSSRRKRDSNTSVHSNTSLSSLTSANSNYRRASLKDESSMMKDEIEGLKILLKQAEAENSQLRQKYETTSEESTRLKDAQKALESTVNNLVKQLEAHGSGQGHASPVSMPVLPPKTSSQELLEAEVKELKESLARMEKDFKKQKDNLDSEVLQLELLVEAKIFREGELESQLEDVRRALAEAKKASAMHHASGQSNGLPEVRRHDSPRKGKATVKPVKSSVSSIVSSRDGQGENGPSGRRSASHYSEQDYDDGLCEICKEDHAVENCPIFGGSAASETESKGSKKAKPSGDSDTPYCDDCEEFGHDLASCPLADEIF